MPHGHTSWTKRTHTNLLGLHRCPPARHPACPGRYPSCLTEAPSPSTAASVYGLAPVKWEIRQVTADHFLKYCVPIIKNGHTVIVENLKKYFFLSGEKGEKIRYNVSDHYQHWGFPFLLCFSVTRLKSHPRSSFEGSVVH